VAHRVVSRHRAMVLRPTTTSRMLTSRRLNEQDN
jgi:hypothetical protein